jgi:hypothetical protein
VEQKDYAELALLQKDSKVVENVTKFLPQNESVKETVLTVW